MNGKQKKELIGKIRAAGCVVAETSNGCTLDFIENTEAYNKKGRIVDGLRTMFKVERSGKLFNGERYNVTFNK